LKGNKQLAATARAMTAMAKERAMTATAMAGKGK